MPVEKTGGDTTSSAYALRAVTPSDSTTLGLTSGAFVRCLYVGTGGNLAVLAADDASAVTLTGIPSGSFVPVHAVKVMFTNTTASNIVAMY